jgi:hypothetical protein
MLKSYSGPGSQEDLVRLYIHSISLDWIPRHSTRPMRQHMPLNLPNNPHHLASYGLPTIHILL